MKKLTVSQQGIINQLVAEFEKINIKPVSTGGLIDVTRVMSNVRGKELFIKECKLEQATASRILDKLVRSDAEKLRADLNILGLDVFCNNEGYCISSFNIIKLGDNNKVSLEYIPYSTKTHVEKTRLGETFEIPKSFKVGLKSGHSYHGFEYYNNIEEVVKTEGFRNKLERIYETLNKTK